MKILSFLVYKLGVKLIFVFFVWWVIGLCFIGVLVVLWSREVRVIILVIRVKSVFIVKVERFFDFLMFLL